MIREIIEDEEGYKLEFFENIKGFFTFSIESPDGDPITSNMIIINKEEAKLIFKRLNTFLNGGLD